MSFHMARLAPEKAVFRPALPSCFKPGIAEMQMAKVSYFEKLKDPRWQKKRLETLENAEWACQLCYDSKSTLHVHHKQYLKGREPWEYDIDQLSVLCESCHEAQHESEDILLVIASKVPIDGPSDRQECAHLLAGYCGFPLEVEYPAQLRAQLLGVIASFVPYADKRQLLRLAEDSDKGSQSEIVMAITRVLGGKTQREA